MLPNPLHPAVVHFPIVFMMHLPLVALGALWVIRRGTAPLRAWAFPVACAAVLSGSAWLAVETGEQDEEKVEAVVAERVIQEHGDAAEQFLFLSAGLLALTAAGLLRGRLGGVLRGLSVAASLGLIIAGVRVGHSGGKLVYGHGAGAAYATPSSGGNGGEEPEASPHEEREPGERGALP
jgi:hypothetical protein